MRARIFYSGVHTDASGATIPFPPARVRAIADRYNRESARHAPAVKGHPSTDDPALGWLDHAIEVKENDPAPGEVALYGRFDRVQPTFAEECRTGAYRFTSIKLYKDDLIRHVGFLGAAQPALAGTEIAFSQGDGETIISFGSQFAEADPTATTSQQDTSMALTPEEIKAIADGVSAGVVAGLKPSFDEIGSKLDQVINGDSTDKPDDSAPAEGTDATKTDGGSFSQSEEGKKMVARQASMEVELAKLKRDNREMEFSQWLDSESVKKRVKPAERPLVLKALMARAELEGQVEFSGADGKTQKGSPVDAYKAEILTWAEFPLGSQFASADNDPGVKTQETEREDRRKRILAQRSTKDKK